MKMKILFALALLWFGLSFLPLQRTSVPVVEPVGTPEVNNILRRACFDCHSTETNWLWYSYIFPVSVFVYHHVDEGREELDFSNWSELSHSKKLSQIDSILEAVETKEMPLPSYLWMHKEAILTDDDIEILRKWQKEMEDLKEEEDTTDE